MSGEPERCVVTILSTNFAGSHFLSLMLGSHSRCMHLGEFRRAVRGGPGDEPCGLCASPAACPLVHGQDASHPERSYDVVWENTGNSGLVLVDASKRPAWARRFARREDLRRVYVHLLRDPRALARRWERTYGRSDQRRHARLATLRRLPRHALRVLLAPPLRVYLYKWLQKNLAISSFLRHAGGTSVVVTYRDLARGPEAELRRIMAATGLGFEPGQLAYWETEHHGSQKRDYEWVKRQKVRHFDARWRDELEPAFLETALREPPVARYLESLGLADAGDGLTRTPAP